MRGKRQQLSCQLPLAIQLPKGVNSVPRLFGAQLLMMQYGGGQACSADSGSYNGLRKLDVARPSLGNG